MDNFWPVCLSHLREQFDDNLYHAFIAGVQVRRDDGGALIIVSPNQVAVRWLEQHIGAPVRLLAKQHFGEEVNVCFRAAAPKVASAIPNTVLTIPPTTATNPTEPSPPQHCINQTTHLRADMTFANFVQGRANELALTAAKFISEGNAAPLNPLFFLYGPTGMGKTHLAQAIGNHAAAARRGYRVRYITARDFMGDVVNSLRLNKMDTFKSRYYTLDLLIVDDIQYIGGDKERTQEEFFFLFNNLHNYHKTIVITSDQPPAQIKTLPARLTSRLRCGFPAALEPPEMELRQAILHQKAALLKAQLDDKVIHFIAEKIKSNVRELEGALNRVLATANFLGKPPSLEMCREVLADLLDSSRENINVDRIKKTVAEFFRLRVADLSSNSRRRSVMRPRHLAVYLCRQMTNLSLPEIGEHFGGREHSTILHSCRFIEQKLKTDNKTQEDVRLLEMLIKC